MREDWKCCTTDAGEQFVDEDLVSVMLMLPASSLGLHEQWLCSIVRLNSMVLPELPFTWTI